jgi:hypothetical protein
MDSFVNEVEMDIHKNLINIDHYMRDLKKHAIVEYQELNQKESINLCNSDSKAKRKKKKVKAKKDGIQANVGQMPNIPSIPVAKPELPKKNNDNKDK